MDVPIGINPSEYCIFFNVCFFCHGHGSTSQPLKRCGGCQLVVYCSRQCQKDDRSAHKYVCKEFPVVNGKNVLHTTGPWMEHINGLMERAARLPGSDVCAEPIFRNPRVCKTCREACPNNLTDCSKCACVAYCSKFCVEADKTHKERCNYFSHMAQSYFLSNMHLSYPMSLKYALQSLPERQLGPNHIPLEDRTTLTVHFVTSRPLFDSIIPWEYGFMHEFPKLKQLKLVFIMQDQACNTDSNLTSMFSPPKCEDCEAKNRDLKYFVHRMQYHEFFAWHEYTEPDVVVVYGNLQKMSASENGDKCSKMFRNMTNSRHTLLVLMNATEDLLRQEARAANAAWLTEELVPPKINLYRGFGSKRALLDTDVDVINDKYYFTCLRRK